MVTHDIAMIHGRFQPFHLGHLEYLVAAAQHSAHLIVGITNSDPTRIIENSLSPHRHTPESNPFSYWQRARMIAAVLSDIGRTHLTSTIVPFPIHNPELWPAYAPTTAVQYVATLGPWERDKAKSLQNFGYQVVELTAPRVTSGTDIRRRIRDGELWSHLVPESVARILHELRI
jgi:cytidyltransferase-like protein